MTDSNKPSPPNRGHITKSTKPGAIHSRARVSSITEVVAAHTRGVAAVEQRAQQIRSPAQAWAEFWHGNLDLDALGWETAELLDDLAAVDARVKRASDRTRHYWEQLWGDDPVLLSVPGMGPILAPTIRAFFADGHQFDDAKAALRISA